MEEKTREELEQEIAKAQEELDSKKAELDAVREQPEDEDLKAKEMALSEEVLILQARLVALQKNLNDVISNEAMAEASQEG